LGADSAPCILAPLRRGVDWARRPHRFWWTANRSEPTLPAMTDRQSASRAPRKKPGRAAARTPVKERHIIFVDELQRHSDREVCLGAAEYAAERPSWAFDPWPVVLAPSSAPAPADLELVNGILTTERAMQEKPRLRRRLRVPVVYCLADGVHRDADAVGIHEQSVGEMAAEHLWSRGYRQFAFIGSTEAGWSRGRGDGFARWLAGAGAQAAIHLFPPETVPVFWTWNLARRNRRLQELVADLPKPCGLFCANDVIACFVLQAARQSRLRVPEEVGVVGVDNDPFPNAAAGLAISSVELPFREVGRQAARLLDERWQGGKAGRSLRLPPIRVVVRASTDAFMTGDELVRKAQAYVEARRDRRITVGEVTRAAGTNRMTLGKHFQRELDMTPLEYVRQRRAAYALERLRQGEANVEEVAFQCGYSSTSYFSRVFKQLTGQRPGAIRRLQSGRSRNHE
jgi:LacI family transcriptional regulator